MNMESVLETFTCHLNTRINLSPTSGNDHAPPSAKASNDVNLSRHFFDYPKILPCCRKTACNRCVVKYARVHMAATGRKISGSSYDLETYVFNCPFCSSRFKFNLNTQTNECDLETNELAINEYERNLIEINHYLVKKLENAMKNIEERLSSRETSLRTRKEYIRSEIRGQIEAIKQNLDAMEEEMLEDLESSCKSIESGMDKFEKSFRTELNEKKILIENLKSNAFSYAYGVPVDSEKKHKLNLIQQHSSVDKCLQNLSELNEHSSTLSEMIGELRFDPNPETPGRSLIGKLKKLREVNLVEQFKTIKLESQINKCCSIHGSSQLMPISPRYLCVADHFNLFFTDSQTKQLIQLKLDTGDFVRSTSLSGLLKNPDGICVNKRTGHIYVSDHELKIILKIDTQLNLVKKFGNGELKWPRGMCYDSEAGRDDSNPNCLYVCDYSNQRISIFNDHDQLRDYLTIPLNGNEVHGHVNYREKLDETHKKFDKALIDEEYKVRKGNLNFECLLSESSFET